MMNNQIDCGGNMVTHTGKYIDPYNLKPEDIDIIDIAQGLSKLCRYAGQCEGFYSVAEHSVLVAQQVWKATHDFNLTRIALLHDAPEAYIGDLVRCVKARLDQYQDLEYRIWSCMAEKWFNPFYDGLCNWDLPDEVKEADQRMCVTERLAIISEKSAVWDLQTRYKPYTGVEIECLEPRLAFNYFKNAFAFEESNWSEIFGR